MEFKKRTISLSVEFDRNDWACFHDTVLDATDKSYNQDELEKLFHTLPDNIKFTAMEWGMSDTVFRDGVYEHLTEQKS